MHNERNFVVVIFSNLSVKNKCWENLLPFLTGKPSEAVILKVSSGRRVKNLPS